MTTANTIDNLITDGLNVLTMAGNVAFGGAVTTGGAFTAASTVTFGGAVSVAGALTIGGAFTISGTSALTLTVTAGTTLTLPTSGTLATLADVADYPFVPVTGTTQALEANKRYAQQNAGTRIVNTLPSTSTAGDVITIIGDLAGGWQVAQNAGDQIFIGNQNTTVGLAGSISSTNQHDDLQLTSMGSQKWIASSGYIGNLTIV